MPKEKGIPTEIIKEIFDEWKQEYGPTFPLYGKETVRHDISGSVRPLLSSTEIPHERVLAEISGLSKRTIIRITSGETRFVTDEVADRLLVAMGKQEEWWFRLAGY